MNNFIQAQKKLLDVIAEETENATSGKPVPKRTRTELTRIAREATDSFLESQKKLLDVAGEQIHANLHAAHRTMGLVKGFKVPIGSMTQEGVKTFVDAEKAMIDNMTKAYEGAKAAVVAERRPRPASRAKRVTRVEAAAV
jgi:hypothetical protein